MFETKIDAARDNNIKWIKSNEKREKSKEFTHFSFQGFIQIHNIWVCKWPAARIKIGYGIKTEYMGLRYEDRELQGRIWSIYTIYKFEKWNQSK